MAYAISNTISKAPLPGGVEISDQEYSELLDGMLQGLQVVVEDGAASLQAPPKPEPIEDDEPEA